MPTWTAAIARGGDAMGTHHLGGGLDRGMNRVSGVHELEVRAHHGVLLAQPARHDLPAVLHSPCLEQSVRRSEDVVGTLHPNGRHECSTHAREGVLARRKGLADVSPLVKKRAQPVGLKRDEGHGMAVPCRVEPHEPSGRRRRPERIQEVGVEMVPLLREEDPAAGTHHPRADVVTEHDGVDEIGSGRALPLRHRHRGGDDRRARVPADDVRAIDFFAMAGRAVGQGGVGSGRPKPGPEDSRFR